MTVRLMAILLVLTAVGWTQTLPSPKAKKLDNDIRYLVRQHSRHGKFAVAVVDSNGVVCSIDGSTPYPLASVFKLPLLVALLAAQDKGDFPSSGSTLTISTSDQCIGSGSLSRRGVGARVSVDEACRMMMSISDNTATDLLFRRFGEEKLDPTLASWGYKGSQIILTNRQAWLLSLGKVPGWGKTSPQQRVKNWKSLSREQRLEKGQAIEGSASTMTLSQFQAIEDASTGTQSAAEDRMLAAALDNLMSAEGLARLLVDLDNEKLLSPTQTKYAFDILGGQKYHSRLPSKLSPGTSIFHKTGTLAGVRNDAGILFPAGAKKGVAVVFLSQDVPGGSSKVVDRLAGQVAKMVEQAYR